MITYLGVRHHGPGCARALERALTLLEPDCVLIEGPPEASPLINACAREGLRPPVALLAYAPKRSGLSCFWPYSEFSPEWVAMRYAALRGLSCELIDLPVAHQLAFAVEAQERARAAEELEEPGAEPEAELEAEPEAEPGAEQLELFGAEGAGAVGAEAEEPPLHPRVAWAYELRRDPLGYLASLAREGALEEGDEGGDGWWEEVIEGRGELSGEEALAFFESVAEPMGLLRGELDEVQRHTGPLAGPVFAGAERERLREASMRKLIKKHSKGKERVVVVCGAWHVPALSAKVKAGDDNALLKGLPKEKVTCLWTPWSEARLAHERGYGAGVSAPAWCRYLWRYPSRDQLTERWLIDAVRLLRAEGFNASSAHVIEATRLAGALAALRARPDPDLEDLKDALVSTLSLKDERPLSLVQAQLVYGTAMGEVPSEELNHPIVRDFESNNKRLRLKLSDQAQTVRFDLRKALHQDKSAYLYRLGLLQIPWGRPKVRGGAGLKGTALEDWSLAWEPEWMMRLIDAGAYGDCVESAASARVTQLAERGHGRHEPALKPHERGASGGLPLSELIALLQRCLRAQLSAPLPALLKALSDEAGLTRELSELLDAIPALIWLCRYQQSAVTGMELSALPSVIEQLLPRVYVSLPESCAQLSAERCEALASRISALHRALLTSGDQDYLRSQREPWRGCLERVASRGQSEPLLRGLVIRLLYERGWWGADEVYQSARVALSPREEPERCIAWLEGFLTGGGLLLIYHPQLRGLIDRWLCSLSDGDFLAMLPLLRRAFSAFSYEENRQLGEALWRDGAAQRPHSSAAERQTAAEPSAARAPLRVAGHLIDPARASALSAALRWLDEPAPERSAELDITSASQR